MFISLALRRLLSVLVLTQRDDIEHAATSLSSIFTVTAMDCSQSGAISGILRLPLDTGDEGVGYTRPDAERTHLEEPY
jgi:hypothetical protein